MKKILFVIMMLAPMSMFAQKFAHFNMAEVLPQMAEYQTASAEIQKLTQQYQEELERLQKEYQTKAEEFQKLSADSNAAQAILQSKGEDLQKQQGEKLEAIQTKVVAAIKKIGEAGAYIYVVDVSTGAIPFVNTALSTDITAQLKTELGIK